MATKFYLRRANSTVTGTLPATTATASTSTPTTTPGSSNGAAATPTLTNRDMDTVISTVAQTSQAFTTAGNTSNQQQPLLRFVSDPLTAQTIASQTITVQLGFSTSNTNSNFSWTWMLTLWRPGTGAAVGQLVNGITRPLSSSAATTSQTNSSLGSAGTSTSVTSQAGDVLVLELWRNATVQGMGTSYTNTLFYDGTTEGSTTNNAAFIQFTNDVAIVIKDLTGAATGVAVSSGLAINRYLLPLAAFIDDFSGSSYAPEWEVYQGSGSLISESGGTLNITPLANTAGSNAGIRTVNTINVADKAIVARLVQRPTQDLEYTIIEIEQTGVFHTFGIAGRFQTGALRMEVSTDATQPSATYPANANWLRLEFEASTNRLFAYYSIDGLPPWTICPNGRPTNTFTDFTAVKIRIYVLEQNSTASPTTIKWDSVNRPPGYLPTSTAGGVATTPAAIFAVAFGGRINGVATVSATLTRKRSVTAAATGATTVSVTVARRRPVTGGATGVSSVNVAVSARRSATGGATGVSSVNVAVSARRTITTVSAGASGTGAGLVLGTISKTSAGGETWAPISGATLAADSNTTSSPWAAGMLGGAVAVGNRIIVVVAYNGSGTPDVTAVVDSLGNTYREEAAYDFSTSGTDQHLCVWSSAITTAGSPSFAISFSGGGGASGIGLAAAAYSGLSTATDGSEIDVSARVMQALDSGSTTGTTSAANQLVIGFYADWGAGGTVTAGTGYTMRANNSPNGNAQVILEEKDSGASGSSAGATVGGGADAVHGATGVIVFGLAAVAPSTHLFEDTFDRANSDTVGGNWVESVGDWDIVSNGVRAMSNVSDESWLLNTTSLGTANYLVSADLSISTIWGTGGWIGVIARYQDANNFYIASIDGTSRQVRLHKRISGTYYELGTAWSIPNGFTSPPSTATLGMYCNGYVIAAYYDGQEVIVSQQGELQTEGDFGLRVWQQYNFSTHLFNSVVVDETPGFIPVFTGQSSQWLNIYGTGGTQPGDLGVSTAPYTFVCLIRNYGGSGFRGIFGNGDKPGASGGGGFWAALSTSDVCFNIGTGFYSGSSSVRAVNDQWSLVAIVVRSSSHQEIYSYNYFTNTWQFAHLTLSLTPTSPTGGYAYIGAWKDGSNYYYTMIVDIAWMGLWSSDLSDGGDDNPASIQEFIDNGPWERKADSDCTFFMAFDRDVTTIPDEAGISG